MTTAIAYENNQPPVSQTFRIVEWEDKASWELLAKKADYQANKLAELCGVSLRTLQRHFAKHHQVKIGDWLRNVRLAEAYGRLKSGDRVKEVAIDLKYKQLSHFSREFKRLHGIAPSFLNGSKMPIVGEAFQHHN
jgi:AraC-like DNA-binding protein